MPVCHCFVFNGLHNTGSQYNFVLFKTWSSKIIFSSEIKDEFKFDFSNVQELKLTWIKGYHLLKQSNGMQFKYDTLWFHWWLFWDDFSSLSFIVWPNWSITGGHLGYRKSPFSLLHLEDYSLHWETFWHQGSKYKGIKLHKIHTVSGTMFAIGGYFWTRKLYCQA